MAMFLSSWSKLVETLTETQNKPKAKADARKIMEYRTKSVLNEKWVQSNLSWPICSHHTETTEHLFFLCPFAVIIWSLSFLPFNFAIVDTIPIHEYIKKIIYLAKSLNTNKEEMKNFILFFASILFDRVWWFRNQVVFHKPISDPRQAAIVINTK